MGAHHGHGHGHPHGRHAATDTGGMRRLALAVVVPLALATLVGLVWLWPSDPAKTSTAVGAAEQVSGEVLDVRREACPADLPDEVNGCGTATVLLGDDAGDAGDGSGYAAGDEVTVTLPNGAGAPEVDVGDDVEVVRTTSPDGEAWAIVDFQRGRGLWVLAVAFVLALVAFGRWRGVTALLGLVVTFVLLVLFVVPAILSGSPPLLVAIVGSAAIVLAVLYLTHGFSLTTTVAVVGTLTSLVLTGLLALAAVTWLHLSGAADDIAISVGTGLDVDLRGLLLAGIVIGSLGVLDDVTVTQAATVAELARADPTRRAGQLYRAAARVGRAHIASVVNTIVLAYAGSSLPLLVLIVSADESLGGVVTDQLVAQELVRSAVATLGLVAAVPVTTALAALVAARRAGDRA